MAHSRTPVPPRATLHVPHPGYHSQPSSPSRAKTSLPYPPMTYYPNHTMPPLNTEYMPVSPSFGPVSPSVVPVSPSYAPASPMFPASPSFQPVAAAYNPYIPPQLYPATPLGYMVPPEEPAVYRTIPGLPFQVLELHHSHLITFKKAEKLFRELVKTKGKYSCWPIHDLYSWYMLCHFGLMQMNLPQELQWNLGRKGVPPIQQEGIKQWSEKSVLYQYHPKEFFFLQFVISVQMFYMYKDHPMPLPKYHPSAFIDG